MCLEKKLNRIIKTNFDQLEFMFYIMLCMHLRDSLIFFYVDCHW